MATISTLLLLLLFLLSTTTHLHATSPEKPTPINSNSILIALLDSHYTQLSELIEKALLLQTLEQAITTHNITIFAPKNEALDRDLDPDFKRFILEPGNINSLQTLILHHILPIKLTHHSWPSNHTHESTRHVSLSHDHVQLSALNGSLYIGAVRVVHLNSITRPDGIIHGVDKLMIPKSVEHDFNNRRNLNSISAVKPQGAPEIDRRKNKLLKKNPEIPKLLSVYEGMAPAPGLAPAPAPGPGGPRHHFDGEKQVKDFIQTLVHYGGYNEMADILVNLTSLASEMGKLISEGYVLTVLAPNDEAMAKLTAEQLSEPGAPEQIVYYHIVPEYQTEESMYNAVRRFKTVSYDTLRLPHKIVAREADGSVRFGNGEDYSGYLFDPDIYTDGRISVQGIDGVLFPPEEKEKGVDGVNAIGNRNVKVVAKDRRGKLLEVACTMLGAFGQDSRFTTCHPK